LQIQDLNAQVASWKGAEAAAMLMLKDSCEAFRSYSDKLVKDKDEAVARGLARVHELESQQRELAQRLQAHAQSSSAAASSLQVAQGELAAAGSLREGLARDLSLESRKCAEQQAHWEQAEEEAREWRARAGEAEDRATLLSAVHAEKVDVLQRRVLEEQGRCVGCRGWGGVAVVFQRQTAERERELY
jgi:hypothetical protein